MNLKFRKATFNDLPEIQTLFVQTINYACKNDYNQEEIDVWTLAAQNKDRWVESLSTQYFLVAEIEQQIVGFGSLKSGNYIDFMYVHKDHLRKGIANKIYTELEIESKRLGFDKMTSDVSKTAKPFFEKNNFKVVKKNTNISNGIEIINFHMSQ